MDDLKSILERLERLEQEVAELQKMIRQLTNSPFPRRKRGNFPLRGEEDIPDHVLGDDDFPHRPFRS